MSFEDYLISKKIDGKAFQTAEPELYESWAGEFIQVHVNSFTAQKLYLINPIRRKYTAASTAESVKSNTSASSDIVPAVAAQTEIVTSQTDVTSQSAETKPLQPSKPARPVFKPKPKIS